jgi:hypothetical protein
VADDEEATRRRAREQLAQQQRDREIAHRQALKRAREQLAEQQAAREAEARQKEREEQRKKDS